MYLKVVRENEYWLSPIVALREPELRDRRERSENRRDVLLRTGWYKMGTRFQRNGIVVYMNRNLSCLAQQEAPL